MSNKTCRECKHCTNKKIIATCKHIGIVTDDIPVCSKFELKAVTNGDRIRQMSNEELAEFLVDAADDIVNNNRSKDDVLAWLNAPAEN
jgi:hypothetical protein